MGNTTPLSSDRPKERPEAAPTSERLFTSGCSLVYYAEDKPRLVILILLSLCLAGVRGEVLSIASDDSGLRTRQLTDIRSIALGVVSLCTILRY